MIRKKRKRTDYASLSLQQRELLQKYNLLKQASPSKAEKFLDWMKSVIAWKKGRGKKPPFVHFEVIRGGRDRDST